MSIIYVVKIAIRYNFRVSNFQKFPGGHASRPPSLACLRMLHVLHT